MSLKHATVLITLVAVWSTVFILNIAFAPAVAELVLGAILLAVIGGSVVVAVESGNRSDGRSLMTRYQFWAFPVTAHRRLCNRQKILVNESGELEKQARECHAIAKTYRDRGDSITADTLRVQADHLNRQAELKEADLKRIDRELEDGRAAKLLES